MTFNRISAAILTLAALMCLPALAIDEVHGTHEAPQVDKVSGPGWPTMSLSIVNEAINAPRKWATVKVDVGNLQLTDPASVDEKPQDQQGHLHYRLNDGPVIATTATKLSFHDLTSGTHKCTVVLAGNDHAPLGPQETVTITIP